jgi:peptide-methionine (S)-S-oxide reductase
MTAYLKGFRMPGFVPAAGFGVAAVALFTATGIGIPLMRAPPQEAAYSLPAPRFEETAATMPQVAILAGGCFWGVQGVFEHVQGVISAVSGYAGGEARTANYDMVSTGRTGHAEAVRVTFDPRQISYGKILQIYFSVVHDPTQLNRQGPDTGTQYRSAIFSSDAGQAKAATDYIKQLDAAAILPSAIVTRVGMLAAFYPAEAYHQDFVKRNPTYPYIVVNDLPKIRNLQRLFPDYYRADPVLVTAG